MQNSTLIRSSVVTNVDQFTNSNVFFDARGILGIATAGNTSSIDLLITDDAFFTGGVLSAKGATFGDFVNLQVVDVDGIMAPAGTVLSQYATNWFMNSDKEEQINISVPYPGKLIVGFYLRISYHSTGATDVSVTANYFLHKALY